MLFFSHIPIGQDACMGSDTIKRLVSNSVREKPYFNILKKTLFSERGMQNYSKVSTNLFSMPGQVCFNKNYSFSDETGEFIKEKFGILKFSNDMDITTIQNKINEIEPIITDNFIEITGNDEKYMQVYEHTELQDDIYNSITNNKDISLEHIMKKLGPGLYIDYSCSGFVIRIFENGRQTVFDPDMTTRKQQERGMLNHLLYSSLMRSFEYLERMNRLLMNNVIADLEEHLSRMYHPGTKILGDVINRYDLMNNPAYDQEQKIDRMFDGKFDENIDKPHLSQVSEGKNKNKSLSSKKHSIDSFSLGGRKKKKKRRKKRRKKNGKKRSKESKLKTKKDQQKKAPESAKDN